MFELHEQLKNDTIVVGKFTLCQVLLHKDASYPWLILVPRRSSMREIHHLALEDQYQLIRESSHLSEVMTSLFAPTTMNIAALGNSVPQLHVHHVARFDGDIAWPRAIWGFNEPKSYEQPDLQERLARLHASLVGEGFEADGSPDDDVAAASFTP